MQETIYKCDKCKKETKDLIKYAFTNENIKIEQEEKAESRESFRIFGLPCREEHPIVFGELCLECVQEIGRWLGHPENTLVGD